MKIFSTIVGALAACGLIGCAHQQEAKTQTAPPPVVAQKPLPPPAPEPAPAPSHDSQDLEAMIRGTVIHFDFNQDLLSSESRERLDKLATAIRKKGDVTLKISGNCDERGTEEYNIALGQRRAEVAKKYLVGLGVDSHQVDTVSFGKEKPAADGHSEDAWAANRRDEFQPR
jgi:peptidoglycan-associated lipoprotein